MKLWKNYMTKIIFKMLGVELGYLLYSMVSLHWTPVCNGAAIPPIKCSLQGGSRGGGYDLWEPLPVGPKLRIDVKFPCKML